jgi:GMP synthase-like glutamine amidotransferase
MNETKRSPRRVVIDTIREMPVPRILVVEHEADSGAVMLGERAAQLGFELVVATPERGIPRSAEGYTALLVMGASPSVNDEHIQEWFQDEVDMLRDADRRSIPVFGVCFGAQALAVALGGSVTRATQAEIGWFDVCSSAPDLIPPGPWMEWHVDAITPPEGAEIVATTALCVQAYTLGKHLAVQFHPEVTECEISQWAESDTETLARLGLDAASLVAETRRQLPDARVRADRLFDAFLRHGGLTAPNSPTS